jgi:hypothetical protein
MAKRKPKTDTRGPLQRALDDEQRAHQQAALDIITPEQRAKGTYTEGTRIINRGGTPVMRWLNAGTLTETQKIAIDICAKLWSIVGIKQSTTANYGERIAGTGNEELRTAVYLEAKEDLARIRDYFRGMDEYWSIWEMVCRFDEPAGLAGSSLGLGDRSAEVRANQIVRFMADFIATKERLMPVQRIRVA